MNSMKLRVDLYCIEKEGGVFLSAGVEIGSFESCVCSKRNICIFENNYCMFLLDGLFVQYYPA